MPEKKVYVFIDEYGTPTLYGVELENHPYFVYGAIIIEACYIEDARNTLEHIYDLAFSARYIKSNRINNDAVGFAKTITALTELRSLPHFVEALVIDKRKINTEGLTYKKSFIKYFQHLLSKKLLTNYSEVHVVFDRTGYQDFKDSLQVYWEKNGFAQDLFCSNTFEQKDDRTEEPLLQLADLYAGTIGKYYCGSYDVNRGNIINDNFLKDKLSIEWFPRESTSFIAASSAFSEALDNELMQFAIESANLYLEQHSDDEVGCEIVRYLLQEALRNPFRCVSSKEIKSKLHLRGIDVGDPIVKVSDLRDNGVIIISPQGKKGYKLPYSEYEVAEFMNRLSSNVVPQLRRGFAMNRQLKERSVDRINVLSNPEFELLRDLCDRVSN